MFPFFLYYTQPKTNMMSYDHFKEIAMNKLPTKEQWWDNCETLEAMGIVTKNYEDTIKGIISAIPTSYFNYTISMKDTLYKEMQSRQEFSDFLDKVVENKQTVLLEDDKIRELLGLPIPDEHFNWMKDK